MTLKIETIRRENRKLSFLIERQQQQSSDYEEELRREQARCFELGMTLQ